MIKEIVYMQKIMIETGKNLSMMKMAKLHTMKIVTACGRRGIITTSKTTTSISHV